MQQSIKTLPIEFPSADKKSTISATLWMPPGKYAEAPRGIVQIVHGMAEHHQRYADFATFLAKAGFAVCAHDHIGHGRSAAAESYGDMPAKSGESILVEDVNNLRHIASGSFPENTPYFIFGHSMGSLVTRVYLAKYGEGLAGSVICGTANEPFIVAAAGNLLARFVVAVRGNSAQSKLLYSLADGAYAKAIEDAQTPLDWISASRSNVDDYIEDEMTGFMFTAGGYATLTALARDAARASTVSRIPKHLPLLFIAGEQDPVGDMGKGVKKAVAAVKKAGIKDVELVLYPNMRHEILNEENNSQVYNDVLDWLERHVG